MAAISEFDNEAPGMEIPDKSLLSGVHAIYSPCNNLLIYGTQRKNNIETQKSNQVLYEVIPKVVLHNKYVRKLVNESHGVFASLNLIAKDFQDSTRRQEISRISQKYRSIILACIGDLQDAAESTGDPDILMQRYMFSDIELVWHLLHILIIDTYSSGPRLLYKLLDWIKWHFLFAEKKMEDIIKIEDPSSHPDFWDTVIQFLLQGKLASARHLLNLHKLSQRADFVSLIELIKIMPMYITASGISSAEFRVRWKHWQEQCRIKLEEGEFTSESNLEIICKILCGDKDVLTEKSYLCANWYHLMVSVLLYTDPCISLSALENMAQAYYSNVDTGHERSAVDSIILAALELDIVSVINYACLFADGWWFAAHITDLLFHGKYITDFSSFPQCSRKFLLMNYADTLMMHSSLWQVGVDYLDQCQEEGRSRLELYLEGIPLDTEAKAKKIVYLAKKRNMDNLVKTISNIMASKAIKNGMLGTALSWLMHSKDNVFADELANRWLNDYTQKRKLQCFEILRNMGSCMLLSDKLTFVGKYCEFHRLYNNKEYKLAAALLISLISSGLAPLNFKMIMLLDALPLLESPDLVFSSKNTYKLMECLEEIVRCSHENGKPANSDDKEKLLRLALIRNLARCFINETGEI